MATVSLPAAGSIHVIDSHTAGEPTRLVVSGGPPLGGGSMAERLARFRGEFDHFRRAIVNEPRGSEAVVGALLCEPCDTSNAAGVIFFNNVGYLGMCGHGAIGLMVTLGYMGRIGPGVHRIETPVGIVTAELHDSGEVSLDNVASYRHARQVAVDVPGFGEVTGDIAWGGNWFYLVERPHVAVLPANIEELTGYTWRIRQALVRNGITGRGGAEIDHIEVFGPADDTSVHSRNFVLCPGRAYDRSPCGTGTSAKLACLYADGKLREGEPWRQQSIVGGVFEGRVAIRDGAIVPTIRGSAFVTAESKLILDSRDPFCWGIRR